MGAARVTCGPGRGPTVTGETVLINQLEKKIISLIQGDIPLVERPFAVMAEKIGLSEEEFLDQVNNLKTKGVIRRFGATLRHQEAGFSSNVMVAWLVPDERIEEVGKTLAAFRAVTHCYHRKPQEDWRYNLYTMIHGSSREACCRIAERMGRKVGITEFELLFSEEEFKKTSMAYF
jgi:DNA-binding Lrp family transcriptional regulator